MSQSSVSWDAEYPAYNADATVNMILNNHSDETVSFLKGCGVQATVQHGGTWIMLYRRDCSRVFESPTRLAPGEATVVSQWLPYERFPVTGTRAFVRVELPVRSQESGEEFTLYSEPIEVIVP